MTSYLPVGLEQRLPMNPNDENCLKFTPKGEMSDTRGARQIAVIVVGEDLENVRLLRLFAV